MSPLGERQRAELEAWDDIASHSDLAAFEAAAGSFAPVRDLLLTRLGDVDGVPVLDCGCGEGALAREAAVRGMTVVGFDISSGMLRRTRSVTAGRPVALLRTAFETLPFADGSFGAATGQFVLHHVDLDVAARELARVLRPGARATFVETWQRNPLIRLARRMRGRFGVARWGTEDERPLQPSDLAVLRRAGFSVRMHYPTFVFLQLFDNNVLRRRWRRATALLERLDRMVGRIPLVRALGYYSVLELERQGS